MSPADPEVLSSERKKEESHLIDLAEIEPESAVRNTPGYGGRLQTPGHGHLQTPGYGHIQLRSAGPLGPDH